MTKTLTQLTLKFVQQFNSLISFCGTSFPDFIPGLCPKPAVKDASLL